MSKRSPKEAKKGGLRNLVRPLRQFAYDLAQKVFEFSQNEVRKPEKAAA
jgi:hypothetical protein